VAFHFLTAQAHQKLDADLGQLYQELNDQASRSAIVNQAQEIIGSVVGTLIRSNWRETWQQTERVSWAWFGDIHRDKEARAVHSTFTEMVRYILDGTNAYLRGKYRRGLRNALGEYLARRRLLVSKATHRLGYPKEQYVTLDQMAAIVGRSKRTLEHKKKAKKNPLPSPDIKGGGGKPDEWKWSKARPWLEHEYCRQLPERFPAKRPI
jgi:hypothetical protein